MDTSQFVFSDFKGNRWVWVCRITLWSSFLLFILLVIFVHSLLILPKLQKPDTLPRPDMQLSAAAPSQESVPRSPAPPSWLRQRPVAPEKPVTPRPHGFSEAPVVLAFYTPSDAESFHSLRSHYQQITHLAPEWFSMRSFEEPLIASPDPQLIKFTGSADIKLLPLLSNLDGDEWQPELIEELARHPEKRLPFFEKLKSELRAIHAMGVLVDWEQIDPAHRNDLTSLLTDLAKYLHSGKLELWLCIPVGNDCSL